MAMTTEQLEKLVKMKHLQALAQRVKSDDDAIRGRLDTLEAVGAQANVLEGVKVNGTALPIAEKIVDILIATGSTNGTISVNGAAVAIAGLAALAFKSEVSEADLASALATKLNAKAEASDLTTLDGKVSTLIGSDTSKSVRTIANEELAAQLIPDDAKAALDTLQEIAAWIQAHPDDAAAMNSAIGNLEDYVGTIPQGATSTDVVSYINEVVAALGIGDYATTSYVDGELGGKVDKVAGKGLSTEDYTTEEKTKLGGVEAGAQVNVIESITYGGATATITSKGAAIPVFGGSSANAAGTVGVVPAPAQNYQGKFLRGDGTWADPANTEYSEATQSVAGLMSASDKVKMDGISTGANKVEASTTPGNIKIDGVETVVVSIASDAENSAMLTEVFGA